MTAHQPTAVGDPERLGFCQHRLRRISDWMHRYVDAGKIPFAATLVARRGEVAFMDHTGLADISAGTPYQPDTIVRFYSMTKPITSLGLLTLYEEGLFHLDDPVEAFIPSFADRHVLRADAVSLDQVHPAGETMTLHHLLTHRSGLTYGFNGGLLGEAYAAAKVDFYPGTGPLAGVVDKLAGLPLLFDPGSRWNYSVSTDVVGRLIEVISGKPLDRFLHERILEPLAMGDTAFDVPDAKLDRFAPCYVTGASGELKVLDDVETSGFRQGRVTTLSGGGGLLSTMGDYLKFADMMRRRGELRGERVAGTRTIDFMTTNHLDGDIASMGPKDFAETPFTGVGFGLGVWSMLNPALAQMSGSPGDYGWGGMASTVFWVDPAEDMIVMFLTQLIPSSLHPLRKELRALVHQALID